jgi:predicted DNA-binding transcriptional regulator AlpA
MLAGSQRTKNRSPDHSGQVNASTQHRGFESPAVLLSRHDLRALGIAVSNPTLLLWEAECKFPKRLTLSPARVAWLQHEVLAWIESKAAERHNAR